MWFSYNEGAPARAECVKEDEMAKKPAKGSKKSAKSGMKG